MILARGPIQAQLRFVNGNITDVKLIAAENPVSSRRARKFLSTPRRLHSKTELRVPCPKSQFMSAGRTRGARVFRDIGVAAVLGE